jgi:hypothetical protein
VIAFLRLGAGHGAMYFLSGMVVFSFAVFRQ